MSDIKFDIYESPANDGEKKKYHVRNTNKQTIHSKDLIHEGYALYFSKPFGLGGSGRGTDRYSVREIR